MKKFILMEDYHTGYISNDPFENELIIPKGSLVGIVPAKAIDKKPAKWEKEDWPKGTWEEALYITFYRATEGNKKLRYDSEYDPNTIIFTEDIISSALEFYFEELKIEFVEV